VVEDAEPQRRPAVDAGRGDEPEPALLERRHEPVDERRPVLALTRRPAKADDPERRRRRELEPLARLDPSVRELGEVERAVDRLAESSDAEGVRSESQTLNARAERVSWSPRSAKFVSSSRAAASRR